MSAGRPYRPLASVPEALDANAEPVLTIAGQMQLEKLRTLAEAAAFR